MRAREPVEVLAQAAAPRSSTRRRRGSRGRPSGTPSRSRRARRRARPRRCSSYGARVERAPRDVPLERDAADDAVAEPGRLRDDAVRAVGADEERGTDAARRRRVPSPRRRRARCRSTGDAVAEVGSGGGRLLGEMEVEPPPLRHRDERLGARRARPSRGTRRARPCDRRRARRRARRRRAACRSARPVRPPPHGLSRGKRALSTSRTLRAAAGEVDARSPSLPARRRRRGRRTAPSRDRSVTGMRSTVVDIETPHGPARAHVYRVR